MMEENKQQEEKAQETKPMNMLEQAQVLDRTLGEKIKSFQELVERNERAASNLILGGRAEAGKTEKTPEQTQKEEIEKKVSDLMKNRGFA